MGDIINLKRERKRKARDLQAAQASENRAKFGAPKAERELEAARRELETRKLEGARRERGHDE